jgi:hypothetical protein
VAAQSDCAPSIDLRDGTGTDNRQNVRLFVLLLSNCRGKHCTCVITIIVEWVVNRSKMFMELGPKRGNAVEFSHFQWYYHNNLTTVFTHYVFCNASCLLVCGNLREDSGNWTFCWRRILFVVLKAGPGTPRFVLFSVSHFVFYSDANRTHCTYSPLWLL